MNKKVISYLFTALLLLLCCRSPLTAQKFEFIPFAGYETGAKIQSFEGLFRIKGGLEYGAALNYAFSQGFKAEISYSRLPSSLTYTVDSETDPVCDLAVNHFVIAALVEFRQGDPVVPFGKFGFGGTYYEPLDSDLATEKVMHFDFSGGVKFYFSRIIGVRLQASFLMPLFYEGIVFEEAAPGPGEGMPTRIAGLQGDFTTGLILRF